jgi:hypothetical protein
MYCLSNPVMPRSAGNFAAREAPQNTALGAQPFAYFWATAKSRSLAEGE